MLPLIVQQKEETKMEKFIPYEKLSKKKKRELDADRRTVWAISPVTRKSENPKAYNRKKAQKWKNDSGSVLSFFPVAIMIIRPMLIAMSIWQNSHTVLLRRKVFKRFAII